MKFVRLIIIVIVLSLTLFIYHDYKQYLQEIGKQSSDAEGYIDEGLDGKPCLKPGGKAYFYMNSPMKKITKVIDFLFYGGNGYAEIGILKTSNTPQQVFAYIIKVNSKGDFIYNDIKYYNGDRLWIDVDLVFCEPPD